MKSDLVTVLDLGSSKAVCLVAGPDGSGGVSLHNISTVESRGIRRGVVVDLDEVARTIDTAVREAQKKSGQEISELVVGIGGAHLEGQNAQGFVPIYPRSRHITREDVLQVINHSRQLMIPPDREMIQALPREFRIDGHRGIQRPIGMNGSKLEVITYIVTGQTNQIQNIEKAVAMGGRKIAQMVLLPLASGLGVLTQEEIELGSAVVDIGGGATNMAVFSGGSIAYSACIPIAGQLVSSDLSKLLKTSPEEAEKLKLRYGASLARIVPEKESVEVMQLGQTVARPLQRKVLCEIIESRMRELATMVRQQIERSGMFGVLPGGVVLTGGGSRLEGTDKLFEDVFKHLRVRVAEPPIDASVGAGDLPGLAASVGMARFAIQCFDDELAPVSGTENWKERISKIFSLLSGRA
jgi:cell division protein FtsA